MAGLGESCSHVAAVLFYVEAAVRLKEKKTVTQEAAYSVLPSRKSSVEYAPLNKIDFTSSKTLKRKLDNFIDDGSSETSITPEKQQTSKDVYRANSDAFRSFMDKILFINLLFTQFTHCLVQILNQQFSRINIPNS